MTGGPCEFTTSICADASSEPKIFSAMQAYDPASDSLIWSMLNVLLSIVKEIRLPNFSVWSSFVQKKVGTGFPSASQAKTTFVPGLTFLYSGATVILGTIKQKLCIK